MHFCDVLPSTLLQCRVALYIRCWRDISAKVKRLFCPPSFQILGLNHIPCSFLTVASLALLPKGIYLARSFYIFQRQRTPYMPPLSLCTKISSPTASPLYKPT